MKKSDEQEQKYRKELMKGLPPINLGALFMPPIWGPANGIWITILYYPLWLFADNLFYASFTDPSPLSVVFSIIVAVLLAAVTIVFARVSQGYAWRARYLARTYQRVVYQASAHLAIAMGILAALMIFGATYYNLVIRPGMPVA